MVCVVSTNLRHDLRVSPILAIMPYRRSIDVAEDTTLTVALFVMTFAFALTETSQNASRESIGPISNELSTLPGCVPTPRFIEWTSVDEAKPDNESMGCVTINWTQALDFFNVTSRLCNVSQLFPVHVPLMTSIRLDVNATALRSRCLSDVRSCTAVAFRVDANGFTACRPSVSRDQSDVIEWSLNDTFAYVRHDRLVPGNNYLISADIGLCNRGLKMMIVVVSNDSLACLNESACQSTTRQCIVNASTLLEGAATVYRLLCCCPNRNVSTNRKWKSAELSGDAPRSMSSPETVNTSATFTNITSTTECRTHDSVKPCIDDQCSRHPCLHGRCVREESNKRGYRCYCIPGYGGANCQFDYGIRTPINNESHHRQDIAPPQRSTSPDCRSNGGDSPCNNGGTCRLMETADNSSGAVTWWCDCLIGFMGHDCSAKMDLCVPNPCIQVCLDYGEYYVCECNPGYTGENCDLTVDPCQSNPCLNNALCLTDSSDVSVVYECQCPTGYHGTHCEHADDPIGLLQLSRYDTMTSTIHRLHSVKTVLYMLCGSVLFAGLTIVAFYCSLNYRQFADKVAQFLCRHRTRRHRHLDKTWRRKLEFSRFSLDTTIEVGQNDETALLQPSSLSQINLD